MADEGSGFNGLWCPVCLTLVGDQARCPECDFPQLGPMPARLRVVVARLHELSVEEETLLAEISALGDERAALLSGVRGNHERESAPTVASGIPDAAPGFAEWRPERVRDVLLWLGAVLLALSALTFSIVAWARLDDAGRAGLLLGATLIAGGAAIGLRHRLRATAEALTGLTLALALVDWYVVRRAGLGAGVDRATWWAIGTALVAAVGLAGALLLDLRAARLGAAVLGLTSGAFAVAATTDAPWTAAVASALVATTVVVGATMADRRGGWRDVAVVFVVGGVAFELATLVLGLRAVERIGTSSDAVGPAIAILAVGLAPTVAVALGGLRRRGPHASDLLVGVSAAAVIGVPVTLLSVDLAPMGLVALAAGLGVLAVAFGRVAPRVLRSGVAGAGAVSIGIASAAASSRIALAVVGPLAWFTDPWSGSLGLPAKNHFSPTDPRVLTNGWATVAVLLAVAAGAAIATSRPKRRAPLISLVAAVALTSGALSAALAVFVPTSGASIGTVLVVELVGAVALSALALTFDPDRPVLAAWWLCGAAVLMVPVAGWGVVEPKATIAVLGVVIIAATITGTRTRATTPRVTLITIAGLALLAEAGAATGAATGHLGPAGFEIAVAGGAVLVIGALARKSAVEGPALECVGVFGLAFGAGLASSSPTWLAAALTAAAAALGCAAIRRERTAYARWTAVVAVGAIWTWLAVADVSALEAYTLPAAFVLIGAGIHRRRANPTVSSWAAYGPGLALGLGPSLLLTLDRGGTARPLAVIAGGLACVLVGRRRKLQAPLTLGAVALITLAIDDLGPVAARIPRWLLLGAIGLLMLWLGASAEHRLNQLRRWRHTLSQLA